jgi:hypothetical protein
MLKDSLIHDLFAFSQFNFYSGFYGFNTNGLLMFNKKKLAHPVAHYVAWLGVSLFATFLMDLWGCLLHVIAHQPLPNYALLGRYVLKVLQTGHLIIPKVHTLPAIAYENLAGWLFHMGVGIADTFIYMIIIFKILKTKPHLLISLGIGWMLIAMPMLIEQPMLGMGVAGRLTSDPDFTRLITFSYHTVFGLGLFVGSIIFHRVFVLMVHAYKRK